MKFAIFKVYGIIFFAFLMSSCQKNWQCTCQGTAAGYGGVQTENWTIPEAVVKPAAQADCDKHCTTFFDANSLTNTSSTVSTL